MNKHWIIEASEDQLQAFICRKLGTDFQILREVEGRFLVDGTAVRIDFLLSPKSQLKKRGFEAEWVGVEVKAPGGVSNRVKKGLTAAWQSVSYSQSEFDGVRPAFVLMFPPIDMFFVGREQEMRSAYYLRALLQKANVGGLYIDGCGWSMRFATQPYFSSDKGRGRVLSAGLRRHVGTGG